MPVFFVGFLLMLLLTYDQQPCAGQGRKANNLRATSFALGTYISLCGSVCVFLDAKSVVSTPLEVAAVYAILLVGGAVSVKLVWEANDKRAIQVTLPQAPWHQLLSSKYSSYVRKVAAEGLLLDAENNCNDVLTHNEMLVKEILELMETSDFSTYEERFIKYTAAAAYLLAASTQEMNGEDHGFVFNEKVSISDESKGRSSVRAPSLTTEKRPKRSTLLMKMKSVLPAISSKSLDAFSNNNMPWIRTTKKKFKGTIYLHEDVQRSREVCIDALLSPIVEKGVKRRISCAFVTSSFKIKTNLLCVFNNGLGNSQDPRFIHAMLEAHCFELGKTRKTPQDTERAVRSISWIEDFLQKFAHADEDLTRYFLDLETATLSEIILRGITSWFRSKSTKRKQSSAPRVEPLPAFAAIHNCANVELEGCLAIVSALWEVYAASPEYASMVDLGLEPSCAQVWVTAFTYISPLLFSPDIRIHAAVYTILNRMQKSSGSDDAKLSDICSLGEEYAAAVAYVNLAKSHVQKNLRIIVSLKNDTSVDIPGATRVASIKKAKKTIHKYISLESLSSVSDRALRKNACLHLTVFTMNMLHVEFTPEHANRLAAEILYVWEGDVIYTNLFGYKQMSFRFASRRVITFSKNKMEPCPFKRGDDCPITWINDCLEVTYKELMGDALSAFEMLCSTHMRRFVDIRASLPIAASATAPKRQIVNA